MNLFQKQSISARVRGAIDSYALNVGDKSSLDSTKKDTVVHSSIRIIASTIAACKWSSDNEQVNRVLGNPNPWQTQYEFIFAIIDSLLTHNHAPQEIHRASNNVLTSITPLHPTKTKLGSDSNGMPVYTVETENPGVPDRTLRDSQVIYLTDMTSYNSKGVSRVESVRTRVDTLTQADENIRSCFRNGITASWLFKTEHRLNDEYKLALLKQIKKELSNSTGGKKGGVLILDHGLEAERVPVGSPADKDLRDLRSDVIREIAAGFGVPPFQAGGSGDTKYNNVSARMTSFFRETLSPLITNIEQKLSQKLGAEVSCDTADLEAGDLRAQVDILSTATGNKSILTQNEARLALGYEEVDEEGADELGSSSSTPEPTGDDPEGEDVGEFPTDTGSGDGPEEE